MAARDRSERTATPAPGGVYFLGDAHLGAGASAADLDKERDLVLFLRYLHGRAAAVYLMGDIFDFWFEYPTVAQHTHFGVVRAMAELAESGTQLRFLGGNHDYWAGENLAGMTGARVIPDSIEETLFGRRVFIAHGDGLPRGDTGYKILKSILRSRIAIAAFRLLHPTLGSAMARWASNLSSITEERIERALPSMIAFLREKLGDGYDAVVVGHVHRPLILAESERTGVIVGDWMWNRSVVRLDDEGFVMLRWSGSSLVPLDEDEHTTKSGAT
jgi:UDP-2,3-diacylglucosamine hydrolase